MIHWRPQEGNAETSSWADARKPVIMQKILAGWIPPLRRKEL
jgi:hypothetical protein